MHISIPYSIVHYCKYIYIPKLLFSASSILSICARDRAAAAVASRLSIVLQRNTHVVYVSHTHTANIRARHSILRPARGNSTEHFLTFAHITYLHDIFCGTNCSALRCFALPPPPAPLRRCFSAVTTCALHRPDISTAYRPARLMLYILT